MERSGTRGEEAFCAALLSQPAIPSAPGTLMLTMLQLDPANNLTTAEILERTSSLPESSRPRPSAALEAGPSKTPASGANAQIVPLPPAASISELKAKLQSKLESFRRDRGVDDSDPQSRDALEQAQRARRAELRENRRKQTKQKRREERDQAAQAESKPAKVSTAFLKPGNA